MRNDNNNNKFQVNRARLELIYQITFQPGRYLIALYLIFFCNILNEILLYFHILLEVRQSASYYLPLHCSLSRVSFPIYKDFIQISRLAFEEVLLKIRIYLPGMPVSVQSERNFFCFAG